MKILSIVGARPNFMKIAPFAHAIRKCPSVKHVIVHTGQHYDQKMSTSFFEDLDIPMPDINLEVGSGSHAQQTAEIMKRFEPVLLEHKPDVLVVVGDVNSTIACSLVAAKLSIPIAHIEAGLRSFDKDMPEEINRILTDRITDVFFTTCIEANAHLVAEGAAKNRIFFVGNVMIDTLMHNLKRANKSQILSSLHLQPKGYALVTLHRPSNVDDKHNLTNILNAINVIQEKIPVVFPIHPRTKKNFELFGLTSMVQGMKGLKLVEPLGYLDFLCLTNGAKMVVTDSGGIQEETTVLKIPCLTVRENTERPITIKEGTNVLVGVKTKKIVSEAQKVLSGKAKKGRIPKYWDGKASERILNILVSLHNKGKLRVK
ncbi:MAG: UDP-N-acetylglucosamine 2-epimerase (non-hydrolyzing) [Candidatus Omnitrophica bacterium]|nr:UDP-N-acetylglucosamine 2-epimerase (non-hydrolyzing) [Candidatus Omnitrophota bacterium]